ncbi:hypothetical protein F4801DRAFT_263033 [Xylaria longipes]|nr:hypothetical protein F4801DRAFT_263033 [Xylaria longipes]
MSHHNSYRPFRLPRANTQDVRRLRNHPHGYQVTADDEQFFDPNTVDDQLLTRGSISWDGDATAMSYTDTSVPSAYAFSDQAVWPEPAVQDTSGVDGTFSYSAPSAFGEPVWERPPATYQPTPHDQVEASMLPAVSPTDGVSAVPEATYNPTEPTPLSGNQVGQGWDGPTYRDWAPETDIALDRMDRRRWSTQARQGSVAALSGDALAYSPTNPPGTIEENNSIDASGDMTTVDQDHFIHGIMGGENEPWCPEFPHQQPSWHYPQ